MIDLVCFTRKYLLFQIAEKYLQSFKSVKGLLLISKANQFTIHGAADQKY
jgi:hypothetical protein